jgi:hypothetical protein
VHPDLQAILEADERARDAVAQAERELALSLRRARDEADAARDEARRAAAAALDASVRAIDEEAARAIGAARSARDARRARRCREADAALAAGVEAYLRTVCGASVPPRSAT